MFDEDPSEIDPKQIPINTEKKKVFLWKKIFPCRCIQSQKTLFDLLAHL